MCFDILDAVQMRSEEWKADDAMLKAKQAKLKRVIEWTKTQERVFKDIIMSHSTCGSCSMSLDLSVSNGATTDWHGPLILKCRHCRVKYAEE